MGPISNPEKAFQWYDWYNIYWITDTITSSVTVSPCVKANWTLRSAPKPGISFCSSVFIVWCECYGNLLSSAYRQTRFARNFLGMLAIGGCYIGAGDGDITSVYMWSFFSIFTPKQRNVPQKLGCFFTRRFSAWSWSHVTALLDSDSRELFN